MGEKTGKTEGRFLPHLAEELSAWLEEGILTFEQAERIRARYDFSEAERETARERDRTVAIVTMAGAALVGVGIILFFAANWSAIPRWGRFALVLLGMAVLYGAGYDLGWRRRLFPVTGRALVIAGCLLYGAGIWLIAQVFNISSHEPNGLLAWALGILPLAAVLRSSPPVTLYSLLLASWTLYEVIGFDRANTWYFPLVLATAFPLVYRDRMRFPLWTTVLAVTAGLAFDAAHWRFLAGDLPFHPPGFLEIVALLAAWGGILVLLGRLHDRWEDLGSFGLAFRFPGHLLLAGLLPVFTFVDAVRQFGHDRAGAPIQAFLLALALAAVFLFLLQFRRLRGRLSHPGTAAVVLEAAAAADSVLLMTFLVLGTRWMPGWLWSLVFNLQYLLLCAVLVFLADRTRRWWTGYLGVVAFTALVVCRYFEYAVRLLPKSFIFIAAGALLLAGGFWLEKRRRTAARAAGGMEVTP